MGEGADVLITRRTVIFLIASVIATIVALVLLREANRPCAVPHSSLRQPTNARLLRVQDDDGLDELPHQPSPCQTDEGITAPDQLCVVLSLILWIATGASFVGDVVKWRAEKKRRRRHRRRPHSSSTTVRVAKRPLEEPGPTP